MRTLTATRINALKISLRPRSTLLGRKASQNSLAKTRRFSVAFTPVRAESDVSNVERMVYPASALWSAFVATSNLVKPGSIANAVFDLASTAILPAVQMRLFAAMAIPLAAAAYRCYAASQKGNASSDTYQRLTLLLAGSFAVTAESIAIVGPGINALPTIGKAFVAWHIILVAGLLFIWYKNSSRPKYILKDAVSTASNVFSPPSSMASAFYAALTVGAVIAGGRFLMKPLPITAPAAAMQMIFGGRLALLALVGYTLKDGADGNGLNQGTFMLLNDSVCLASGIAAAVLYKANGAATTLVIGLALIAVACGFIRFDAAVAGEG